MQFKSLSVGDKFHTGKSKGSGAQSEVISWHVFEKIPKSSAKIVEAHGNFHRTEGIQAFSAMSNVWTV